MSEPDVCVLVYHVRKIIKIALIGGISLGVCLESVIAYFFPVTLTAAIVGGGVILFVGGWSAWKIYPLWKQLGDIERIPS